jgi:uncharacterized damage-inducible protein DinB
MIPTELTESYIAGVAQLRAAVADMTREQLVARPIPGKWSTLEVVAHIADFEPVMVDRIKRVVSHDNPLLLGADEHLFAEYLFYHDRDIEEEMAVIEAIRTSVARTLRRLSADSLKRVGTHNEAGELTLEQLIQRATQHITHHLTFIREKRAALGLRT